MLLSIDIGNTLISIGIHSNKDIVNHFYLETSKIKTSDEFAVFLLNLFKFNNICLKKINSSVISSVVPQINKVIIDSLTIYFKINPLIVNSEINLGIKLNVDNPKEVGSDLISDSVSAYFQYGGNCIIINSGTAIKCSVITNKAEFLGVLIFPGYEISKEALISKTSLLPSVDFKIPKNLIGKNSIEAIENGLYYGYQGLIKYLIYLNKKEYGKDFKVILSGGCSHYLEYSLKKYIDIIDYDLTLKGLKILYEKNKN